MTNLDKLPGKRGVYRVETVSGTVHILDIAGRTTWERRPGPGATTERYDYSPRVLSELGPGWEVGRQGFLVVADESYLGGATTHLTATILSITEEPPEVREHSDDVRWELLRPVSDQLPNIAGDRIPESDRSIESVAETMLASLPTEVIDNPPVRADSQPATDIVDVVSWLRLTLGARLTAYLASLNETRILRDWAHGTSAPSDEVAERLRLAHRVTTILLQWESQGTVQAWFQGMNPNLKDAAPAQLIREGDLETVEPAIFDAVAAFFANG